MVRICLDFTVIFVLATIALIVISGLLAVYAGFDAGIGTSFVPPMVGALFAGQNYVTRTKTMPENGLSWKAALMMTLVSFTIGVVVVLLIFGVATGTGEASPLNGVQSFPVAIFAAVVLVIGLLQLLVIRFFFGMGAKQSIKLLERRMRDTF